LPKPAARIGDEHFCPKATPGTPPAPHIGGPVASGCLNVLIEDRPAARIGDLCTCIGEPDTIITGSSGVYIGGQPAARMGDKTAHGGKIMLGSRTVLIGESMGLGKPDLLDNDEKHTEPSKKEKIKIIEKAIEDCITVLEIKLALLIQNDDSTLMAFTKWFGYVDESRKQVIVQRIKRQLELCKMLALENFKRIPYEINYRNMFAYVYPTNEFTIYLGKPFWNMAGITGKDSNAWILVHELSHFKSIGGTKDYAYDEDCESFAKDKPSRALYNADSFAYFIIL
jgi:uncharacterized Zn-binding protein involved in type VI secretion